MRQLRVLHAITAGDDELVAYAAWARAQDGCLEAEPNRRTTGDRRALLVERWTDESAFGSFWRRLLDGSDGSDARATLRDAVSAPDAAPSEFYARRTFHQERGWVDDALPDGGSVIAWPGHGAVRVLIVTSVASEKPSYTRSRSALCNTVPGDDRVLVGARGGARRAGTGPTWCRGRHGRRSGPASRSGSRGSRWPMPDLLGSSR